MENQAPAFADPYAGIVPLNNEPDFDGLLKSQLKCYVYALGGPEPQSIFYIGKAGGKGEGNQRVLDHFISAHEVVNSKGSRTPTRKEARIIETWRQGKAVPWSILRRGLETEEEALHVEAALIDLFGLKQLTNEKREWTAHGKLTIPELGAMAAPSVQVSVPYSLVLLFNIKKSFARGESYYDATRMIWAMGREFRTPGALAVGLIDGVSYGVFEVIEWTLAPGERRKRQFTGNELRGHELLNRNFSSIIQMSKGAWMRATPLGVEFQPGQFRFKRGAKDQEQWHQLPP